MADVRKKRRKVCSPVATTPENGQQHQPTSTGLRERLVDHDLERREHVRRVARVGFQPRVQVYTVVSHYNETPLFCHNRPT